MTPLSVDELARRQEARTIDAYDSGDYEAAWKRAEADLATLLTRIKNYHTEIRAAVDRILAGEDPRAVFEDFGVFDDALTPREEKG